MAWCRNLRFAHASPLTADRALLLAARGLRAFGFGFSAVLVGLHLEHSGLSPLLIGVTLGVGLAPMLGKIHVPGFSPIAEVFPVNLQRGVLPFATFLLAIPEGTARYEILGVRRDSS